MTDTAPAPSPNLVRFGRRSSRGLLLGFSAARVGCIAAAAAVFIPSLLVAGILYARKQPWGRLGFDWHWLNAPILGSVCRKVALSRSMRTLGTMIGAGVSMLDAIRLAVTRHRDGSAAHHDEVVGVADAWRAFTTTPADVAGDYALGRIAIGARADLIMLDGDPFVTDADLAALAVRATMVDGRLVHGEAEVGG